MSTYTIYKYVLKNAKQGNLFDKTDSVSVLDKAQEIFQKCITDGLTIVKENYDKTLTKLDNDIEIVRDNVLVMLLCNEKNHKYKEKRETNTLVFHPGCYVIVDNRPNVAQIAIEKSSAFDNDPDKVRNLLETALNQSLASFGLKVDIQYKYKTVSFWDMVNNRCEKSDRIKKVEFDFPNPKHTTALDTDSNTAKLLQCISAFSGVMNASDMTWTMNSSKTGALKLDQTVEDISQLVSLCCQNGYNISVHFEQYGCYRLGSQVKLEMELKEAYLKEFISGQKVIGGNDDGTFFLLAWLEEIRKIIVDFNDEISA